jgi:AcrR family transcriptional regulator
MAPQAGTERSTRREATTKRTATRKQNTAKDSASNERRAELLETAARVFAEKGFAHSTVRDIGDECGILSGSLYYHFTSKDAMLLEVLESALDRLLVEYTTVRDQAGGAEHRLARLFEVALQFIVHQPHAAMILQTEFERLKPLEIFAPLMQRHSEIRTVWLDVLRQGVDEGVLREDIEMDLAYRVLLGAVLSTVHWFDPTGHYSVETVAKTQTTILINGLARPT